MGKDEKIELRCSQEMKAGLNRLCLLMGAKSLSQTAREVIAAAIASGGAHTYAATIPALRVMAIHLDRLASTLQRLMLSSITLEREAAISRTLAEVESLSHRAKDLLPPKR